MAERAVSFGVTASPRRPGPELRQSVWFTDVRQSVVERCWA